MKEDNDITYSESLKKSVEITSQGAIQTKRVITEIMEDSNHKTIEIKGNELRNALDFLQKWRTEGIDDKDFDKALLYILDSPKSSSNGNNK